MAKPQNISRDSGVSIGAVERDTGFSKDTLRVWEKRYRFPAPARDQFGERVYSSSEVEKLRAVKRLMDLGHRPGKIISMSLGELGALAGESSDRQTCPGELLPLLGMIKAHRIEVLRQHLSHTLMRQGLLSFLLDTVVPLNRTVGDLWARGDFQIFEEHLYTEALQAVMRGALNAMQRTDAAPRVLLTTLPGEQHGLGLLMAEAILVVEGCACVSLGTQTPVQDIVLAAGSQRADVVALSFSAAFPAAQVWDALKEMRQHLPVNISVWAGGGNAVLAKRVAESVTVISGLDRIPPAVAAWRASLAATSALRDQRRSTGT
jgi:methanogenic corrinoid protein MtbC1